MHSSVFLKTLRDHRWPMLWFSLGLAAVALYSIMLYPIIAEASGLLEFMESLPEGLTALFGGALDYSTVEGFLSADLFSFVGPLVFLAFTVSRGSAAIAGEEEAGTLDQLLANPLPRWRLLLEKSGALAVATAAVAVVFWSALAIGAKLAGVDLGYAGLTSGVLSIFLLGAASGMLAVMLSAATGKRNASAGITAGVAALIVGTAAFARRDLR